MRLVLAADDGRVLVFAPSEAEAEVMRGRLATAREAMLTVGDALAAELDRVRVVVASAQAELIEVLRAQPVELPPPIQRVQLDPELLARLQREAEVPERPRDWTHGRKTWPEPRGRARAGGRRG